ncbi:hypothetical protein QIS99_01450 [Streptomyces sp. B-S-A8]|uniref:Uncharacterized protein n=1 Tax=Streptomyces solicavernae TaxID=3043614 RepID=A0ABT6RKE0_9ACTN|nr:hypothetical protein [Streptomyces sp. B-S-A8]MDI3384887.1 hypothetical protein [Streptomyces sp. B-S-A8]
MTQAMSRIPGTPMTMTKDPQQPTASPAPASPAPVSPTPASSVGAPATSTPIYDALVREWYEEGRNSGAQRGGGAESGAGTDSAAA